MLVAVAWFASVEMDDFRSSCGGFSFFLLLFGSFGSLCGLERGGLNSWLERFCRFFCALQPAACAVVLAADDGIFTT